jgi:hypothetical protein
MNHTSNKTNIILSDSLKSSGTPTGVPGPKNSVSISIGIHDDEIAAVTQIMQSRHLGHRFAVHQHAMKCEHHRQSSLVALRRQIDRKFAYLAIMKEHMTDFTTRTGCERQRAEPKKNTSDRCGRSEL